MRVAVDARAAGSGRGVARYLERTLQAAAGTSGTTWAAVLPQGAAFAGAPSAGVEERPSRHASRVLFGLAAATGRPRLERLAGGADVVWLPAPAPVAVGRGVPVVLTVHDLSFVQRPGDFTPYERLWHRAMRIDRLLARAAAIVCVSDAVAGDVRARRPELAPRVRVIAPGVDRAPAGAPAPLPPGLPPRFLLYVGALEPRKAPGVLADAYAAARARGLDAGLVVAGEGREAAHLHGDGVHHLGRVDDATLHALYGAALAVVLPSHLEGFGLPPLEAAAHGTPAVVSDLPVFRATIGAGALRVPPGDASALAAALLDVAGDAALRERLATAGRAAIAPLSWEASAAALVEVLTQAARA